MPGGDSIDVVRGSLAELAFGNLVVTVHEDRLVQNDIAERRRFKPT